MQIHTDKAPKAIGPYSQAIVAGNLIFTSGQIALTPGSMELSGEIAEQTKQVLENLKSVLEAAGSSLKDAIKVTVYLKNIADFSKMNEVYAEYFTSKPARSTVEVSNLPKGALIEIDAIALKK